MKDKLRLYLKLNPDICCGSCKKYLVTTGQEYRKQKWCKKYDSWSQVPYNLLNNIDRYLPSILICEEYEDKIKKTIKP